MILKTKKYFKTGLTIILALFFILSTISVQAATIQLPKGTEVKLKFVEGMKISSGDLSKGIPIIAYLEEAIEIGGKTVVEKGAQATANVAEVTPAGKPGKPGHIKIEFVELETKGAYQSIDGSKIKLTGILENTGKSKKTLSLIFIFGLFIKGTQGEITTNAVYTVQVAESIILESK
jgi:hypothetical protein